MESFFDQRTSVFQEQEESYSTSEVVGGIKLFLSTLFLANQLFCCVSRKLNVTLLDAIMASPEKFVRMILDKTAANVTTSSTFQTIFQTLYLPQFTAEYGTHIQPLMRNLSSGDTDWRTIQDLSEQRVQLFVQRNLEQLKKKVAVAIQSCTSAQQLVELEELCMKLFNESFYETLYVLLKYVSVCLKLFFFQKREYIGHGVI